MIFECKHDTDNEVEIWQGEIKNVTNYDNYYEALIISRSSIYIIFGKTTRGGFLCAPDFGVGCHLVSFNNKFWNKEKLIESFGMIDGVTVFFALKEFSKYHVLF